MLGIAYATLAGILVSLQVVFNNQMSEKIGIWETTTIVHLLGLALSASLLFFSGDGSLSKINEVNKLYLAGGFFGAIVVFSSMRAMSMLGAAHSISIMLVTQLIVALMIDVFGLFGTEKIHLDFTKPLGVVVMIVGIIIFKSRS